MPKSVAELKASILNKSATVGVIGLGYVGVPLIRAFVQAGFRTMGFDIDQTKVDRLLAGQSYIGHIPSEWIAECIETRRFTPTADMRRLAEADALLICVPTPLSESRDPDLSYIEGTARYIAAAVATGTTHRAGKHHVSRHHPRRSAADSRGRWLESRQGFLPGV